LGLADKNLNNFETQGMRLTFVTKSRGESVILTKKKWSERVQENNFHLSHAQTEITMIVDHTTKEKEITE
jgi:hypothetical protein